MRNVNLLTPNVDYSGRTAPLTSKCCILYIYSTHIDTENFKHGIYSPFFPLRNAVCFINLTNLVPVFFTFYIQDVLKLKNNSGAKRLILKLNNVSKCEIESCVFILVIKPTRCTNFSNLFLEQKSTCFGQVFCPSSGV